MTATGKAPRHEFVPIELQPYAYDNIPLPIGFAKTISQPFIVALMTDLLDIKANDSVLEIGTGLGYQAAILAQLGYSSWGSAPFSRSRHIDVIDRALRSPVYPQYPANVDAATAKHIWKVRSVGDETSRVHVRKTRAFERGARPHLFTR